MTTEHEPETRTIELLEMSATQARRRFRRVLSVVDQNTVVMITRRGRPIAYMVPVWLYETCENNRTPAHCRQFT